VEKSNAFDLIGQILQKDDVFTEIENPRVSNRSREVRSSESVSLAGSQPKLENQMMIT